MSSLPPRSPTKPLRFATFAATVALALAVGPLAQAQNAPASASANSPLVAALPSFSPLVKKVMPAVVNISATLKPGADLSDEVGNGDDQNQDQDQGPSGPDLGPQQGFPQSPFDEMLRRFFEQQGRQAPRNTHEHTMALGSGFIIDPTGYIVTNNHVVQQAEKVSVIFQDGSEHPAKIIGRDTKTDLALLKIDAPKPLPYVSWGKSDAEQVGDWVLAVGNPFGLGGSVSPGFVSARGRDIHAGPYDDFLQIDASINRGNSGGPTFNLDGQVVGINTAIYSPNGGSVGIGFAIPSDLAKPVIDQLREHGKVERGWLGVQIQQVTPEIAKSLKLPKDEGALVSSVTPDSPAAKAGFKQGDVILSFNGHAIDKMRSLPILVAETPANQAAAIRVWRSSGETNLSATIAAMPANPQVAENSENSSTMGLQLAPLDAASRQRLHIGSDVKGVVVTKIAENSPLAELGLERGDVIESINQQKVATPDEAARALKAAKKDKQNENVLILLDRHGVDQYVALSLSSQDNG
ncbi:MAG TPA: DegQ family serine endoprotease [Stellaceae bacterium]|nr:DegQ family serine endoprotease [Stellaceae bacterium]